MSTETMDSRQCGELLRCTSEQVEELARAGEIPALQIGRSWLFMRADLLVFLAEKARADAKERRAGRKPSRASPVQEIWSPGPQADGDASPHTPAAPTKGDASDKAHRKERAANPDRLVLTAADAARLLSMGQSTFWREVKLGHLPKPIKIGGITRWRLTDLTDFVDRACG